MADIQEHVLVELVRPVLNAWLRRNERDAAKRAGALTFWRDGMLRHLEAIAEGKATKTTFKALQKEFNESEGRVTAAMQGLRKARNKLAGSKVADQIDRILFDNSFGKNTIRSEIHEIISEAMKAEPDKAQHVCNDIRTLNAELERLNRMVDDM